MKYVVYDPAVGTILQWGEGEPPPGSTYLEHSVEGALADYCVLAGNLVTKPPMQLTWDAQAPADGQTAAAISGIPSGTHFSTLVSGERFSGQIPDGVLEIAAGEAQAVTVRFWHPVYQHAPVEVTFT